MSWGRGRSEEAHKQQGSRRFIFTPGRLVGGWSESFMQNKNSPRFLIEDGLISYLNSKKKKIEEEVWN